MLIEVTDSAVRSPTLRAAVLELCEAAYGERLEQYLQDIGPGRHFLGSVDRRLVAHLMVVQRTLVPVGGSPLRTAYIELVATAPHEQGKGYASALLRYAATQLAGFDIAALSPTSAAFYARLGWELWTGPLAVRTAAGLDPTPDESVMILRLPRTPPELDLTAPLSVEWRPGEVW